MSEDRTDRERDVDSEDAEAKADQLPPAEEFFVPEPEPTDSEAPAP